MGAAIIDNTLSIRRGEPPFTFEYNQTVTVGRFLCPADSDHVVAVLNGVDGVGLPEEAAAVTLFCQGLVGFILFPSFPAHAPYAQNDGKQQQSRAGHDQSHACPDARRLRHEAHQGGGDDAPGASGEDHDAASQVVALNTVAAEGKGRGIDGGHKEAHSDQSQDDEPCRPAKEHHQEKEEQSHAVGHKDAVPGDLPGENRAHHPGKEDYKP